MLAHHELKYESNTSPPLEKDFDKRFMTKPLLQIFVSIVSTYSAAMALALAASRTAILLCRPGVGGDRGARFRGGRVRLKARLGSERIGTNVYSRHRVRFPASCARRTAPSGGRIHSRTTARHVTNANTGGEQSVDNDEPGRSSETDVTAPTPTGKPTNGLPPPQAQRVVLVCAFAMLLASADRTIFSLAALAIAADLNLNMTTVGVLQSAFLWGYGVTQVIGGVAADILGGARILLFGLLCWSIAVAAIPISAMSLHPVPYLIAARFLFGAASGCAVPSAAAAVAKYIPSDQKSVGLSTVFAAFNCGSAFGLLLAGGLIATAGWQTVFTVFGLVGLVWAVLGFFLLPDAARQAPSKEEKSVVTKNSSSSFSSIPRWMIPQLLSLAWCHMCVNFGFFQLQSWLPAYMARDLRFTLGNSGLIAAFPWFVCAAASFTSGKVADKQIQNGEERWKVRRAAMRIATVGPALSLSLLAALNSVGVLNSAAGSTPLWAISLAIGLVASTLATQAVAIAGFHAYLQDVAPAKAGAFLGVTNTLGVFAGIAANVLTGVILTKTGKFDLVFLVTAAVYLSSGAVWERYVKGQELFPN